MSDQNVATIQAVFEAFGRGDVPFILDRVSEDTEWGYDVRDSQVPWHQPVRGKANVAGFFERLISNVDYASFEPKTFVHSGQDVVAHVHQAYTVKRTGKKVDEDLLLWWTFGSDGKIARLVHFEDTAQVVGAWGA